MVITHKTGHYYLTDKTCTSRRVQYPPEQELFNLRIKIAIKFKITKKKPKYYLLCRIEQSQKSDSKNTNRLSSSKK